MTRRHFLAAAFAVIASALGLRQTGSPSRLRADGSLDWWWYSTLPKGEVQGQMTGAAMVDHPDCKPRSDAVVRFGNRAFRATVDWDTQTVIITERIERR